MRDDGFLAREAVRIQREHRIRDCLEKVYRGTLYALAILCALAVLTLLFSIRVNAASPEPGSEDYEVMHPYKDWVETQHASDGHYCCNWADGRLVESRIAGDHYEIHITPKKYPGSTDHWAEVPKDSVLREMNPTGVDIAWVIRDHIYCFAPSNLY